MWELARRSPVGPARSGIHTLWPNFAIGAMFSELRAEGVLRSTQRKCPKLAPLCAARSLPRMLRCLWRVKWAGSNTFFLLSL